MVVHELLDRTDDYDLIRSTIESLRERYGADWPLTYSAAKLGTYGTKKQQRIAFSDTSQTCFAIRGRCSPRPTCRAAAST